MKKKDQKPKDLWWNDPSNSQEWPLNSQTRAPPLAALMKGVRQWGGFDFKTDVKKRGLASADRNNKATLLLTAPYSMTKSYAKGLSPRMVKLQDVS